MFRRIKAWRDDKALEKATGHYMDLLNRYYQLESLFDAMVDEEPSEAQQLRYRASADLQLGLLEEMRLCIISYNVLSPYHIDYKDHSTIDEFASKMILLRRMMKDGDKVARSLMVKQFNSATATMSNSPVTNQFRRDCLERLYQSIITFDNKLPFDNVAREFASQKLPMLFHASHSACAYIFNVPRDHQ